MDARLAALHDTIETAFRQIADTRMAGLPFVNAQLGVALRGLRAFGEDDVGVLVTPWFMNLIVLPREAQAQRRIGTKSEYVLPSGPYEVIWSQEDSVGGYWSASLFSPMAEFVDMDTAIATADAVADLIFAAPEEPEREAMFEAMVDPGAGSGVEERLATAQRRAEEEAAAAEEASKPKVMDRRALFGLRRSEGDLAEAAR